MIARVIVRVRANVGNIGQKFEVPHPVLRELDMAFDREKERVINGVFIFREHLDFKLVFGHFHTERIVLSFTSHFDFVIGESFLRKIIIGIHCGFVVYRY